MRIFSLLLNDELRLPIGESQMAIVSDVVPARLRTPVDALVGQVDDAPRPAVASHFQTDIALIFGNLEDLRLETEGSGVIV
jgi:hypothetical protein